MKNEMKIENSCLCRKEFYNQLLNTRTHTHTHTQFIEQKTLRKDIENNTETKRTSWDKVIKLSRLPVSSSFIGVYGEIVWREWLGGLSNGSFRHHPPVDQETQTYRYFGDGDVRPFVTQLTPSAAGRGLGATCAALTAQGQRTTTLEAVARGRSAWRAWK